ncbi:hypothetical protein D0T50_08005 [Bacteroides sp. 214]|uniref:hypothetical protein n=1 Tax=Bacteroides sp. 214 TaxID=2302935 RepID=UPI0019402734|nr:hypothetical protein [Bacteroides sp. 214]NDW12833.1 hypothetical protein [Bacteroides sp. 214]
MSEFGTDTIAYMRYNFVERKTQYINQPLSKLLSDYELGLVFAASETFPYKTTETVRIDGAILQYPTPPQYKEPYAFLIIDFKAPHLPWWNTYNNMINPDDSDEWAEKLKNCIVSDIELVIGPFHPN